MELIKRKIILNGLQISGNTVFPQNFVQPDYEIGIYLTQTFEDIGIYTDLLEKDSKEIFSNFGQSGKLSPLLSFGVGLYGGVFNVKFVSINDTSSLISKIQIGTSLNISFNNISDIVIINDIVPVPQSNIVTYILNKSTPGLNSGDQINILVIGGFSNNVFLSDYIGTDNSGSGEIITTGTSTNFQLSDFITNQNYIISGKTDNRLNEVKTFKLLTPFIINNPELGNKWIRNIGIEQNTNREFIEYTITPIDYKTYLDNNETIYIIPSKFLPQNSQFYTPPILSGHNISNTSLSPTIKEESKMGLVESPKINSDLFANRKETSVFENHLRLNEIIGVQYLIEYSRKFYLVFDQ